MNINLKTTVPHLVLERHPHIARAIEIPEDIKGDLDKEHDFLFPLIMKDFPTEWDSVCEEVDESVEGGSMVFDGETGTITIVGW